MSVKKGGNFRIHHPQFTINGPPDMRCNQRQTTIFFLRLSLRHPDRLNQSGGLTKIKRWHLWTLQQDGLAIGMEGREDLRWSAEDLAETGPSVWSHRGYQRGAKLATREVAFLYQEYKGRIDIESLALIKLKIPRILGCHFSWKTQRLLWAEEDWWGNLSFGTNSCDAWGLSPSCSGSGNEKESMCVYIYTYIYIYIYMSTYIYIYIIYTHIHTICMSVRVCV